MRVVREPAELDEALDAARREAAASFGDDRLLLERYLARPRHVEVQVLGDVHGALVHLGERECSVQRRHQKLIEESPSPAVTGPIRAAMGEAALRLARAAGYANAGTVEFLLDEDGSFFFLEVNARLQVEHPVTEAVTGLDLVEQQLRVAAGEPLGFSQADVRLDGWAMELRVVAEDAAAGFLPSTGVVTAFDLPATVRVDTGVGVGSTVSPFYDSLLAKVIAHGADRSSTIATLVDALDATRIEGVATNVDLLAAVLDEPAFRAGDLHTGFLDEHGVAARLADVARRGDRRRGRRALARAGPPGSAAGTDAGDPWLVAVPWRPGRIGEPLRWVAGGRVRTTRTSVAPAGGAATVTIDGSGIAARRTGGDAPSGWTIEIGAGHGARAPGRRRASGRDRDAGRVAGTGSRSRRPRRTRGAAAVADTPDALTAPMPGRIVRIHVEAGAHVREHTPLVILEAMKMEHVIAASAPGRVARVHVAVGDQVQRGQLLVDLEAAEPAAGDSGTGG